MGGAVKFSQFTRGQQMAPSITTCLGDVIDDVILTSIHKGVAWAIGAPPGDVAGLVRTSL